MARRISKIVKNWIEYNIVWWWTEAVDIHLDSNSENPVQNKVITQAINEKQDTLTAWPNTCIYEENDVLKICAKDTTYERSTQESDWLMSSTDKIKLDKLKYVYWIKYLIVWGWWGWWYVSTGWWGWEVSLWNTLSLVNTFSINIWSWWTWTSSRGGNWWDTTISNAMFSATAKWWRWGWNENQTWDSLYWYSWNWNKPWESCSSCHSYWWGWWAWSIWCNSWGNWWNWWTWLCWYWWGWWWTWMSWNNWWSWVDWWGDWKAYQSCGNWWNATNCWWWGWSAWCYIYKWGNWWWWIAKICYPSDWSFWFKNANWWTKSSTTEWWINYCVHTFTANWTFTITG